jgi:gas vesicle protein
MSNERRSGLIAFLAGAALGGVLGILFAPDSGKETRDRIKRKVREGKDEVDDFIDHAHEEWSKAKGKASEAANMTKDEVSDFVRFLFEEGKDLKERIKGDVKGSADDVADHARKAADNVRHSAN